MTFYEKWKQWQYYVIIGVISLVALFFLPMIGSEAGLAWTIPTTAAGWLVYIVSKLLVATINILIFHCFILQAKMNIEDNPRYIEATKILDEVLQIDTEKLRSPKEYFSGCYGKKGLTIFATSILSAVGLTQAVLSFDWISMLTYFFTILMGVVFGILQMNQTELYWTTEYPKYAKKVKADKDLAERKAKELLDLAENKVSQQINDCAISDRGTSVLESSDNNRDSSTC